MNHYRWLAPGVVAGLLFCCSLSAQAVAPTKVSLADAVESAWQRAVQARQVQGREHMARAQQSAADRWLAATPTLELYQRDDRFHDDVGVRESEINVSLPLWLPGQRAAKQEAAATEWAAVEAARGAARLRVAAEVREAAWLLAARQAERASARGRLQGLQRLADDVRRRVAAGELARSDALAADAERLAAQASLTEAEQALRVAEADWTVLTGLPPQVDPTEHVTPDQPAAHPEVSFAEASFERAQKQLTALQKSRWEPPQLTLGMRRDRPGDGLPEQDSVIVGVRVPLGSDTSSKAQRAAALGELEMADLEAQRLRARRSADLETAQAGVAAAEQQLAAEALRFASLRERAELLDRSFRAGETALPDLLRALTAAAEGEAALARQRAALGLAQARLYQTLGILP